MESRSGAAPADPAGQAPSAAPPTWELIRQIQAGDRQAADILCRRYGPRVARLVRRSIGRRLRARLETQDLVQSAFLEVLRGLPGFTYRGEAAFLAWPAAIVERMILALPWEAIARAHGASIPAVQMRLARAKARLARMLRPSREDR